MDQQQGVERSLLGHALVGRLQATLDVDFIGAILPRTTAGNAVAERPQSPQSAGIPLSIRRFNFGTLRVAGLDQAITDPVLCRNSIGGYLALSQRFEDAPLHGLRSDTPERSLFACRVAAPT